MSKLWEKEEFFESWEIACEEVVADSYTRNFVTNIEAIEYLRDEVSNQYEMLQNNEVGETDWDVAIGLLYSFVQVLQYTMDCSE